MSEAQPIGPSGEGALPQKKGIEKRPLNEQEAHVESVAHPKHAGGEMKAVDVPREIREASQDERSQLPSGVASVAVASVEQELEEAVALRSIHEKWSPRLKEYLEQEDIIDTAQRIINARGKVQSIKDMYTRIQEGQPLTQMEDEVAHLLETGSMESVEGGVGGVYFLSSEQGQPRYVLKPGDEALLAVNNGKGMASPYLDEDDACSPVKGGRIYETVQNGELAYKAAEIFNLQEVTPRTEVMIIESPYFHDVMDGTIENESEVGTTLEGIAPSTQEKVCLVQSFIPGCQDIGAYLSEQSQLDQAELKRLLQKDPDKYQEIEDAHTPRDIDQTMYEKIALLTWITGEKDGNAGNFLLQKSVRPDGQRPLYKIDNSASFPEHNTGIRSGLYWVPHNFDQVALSEETKDAIMNISPEKVEQLKSQMRARGKSQASIDALDERIRCLQEHAPTAETVADLDDALSVLGSEAEG